MDREKCVAQITSVFGSVVEGLFDECQQWPEGQWLAAAEQRTREVMVEQARQVLQTLIPQRFGLGHCGAEHVDALGQRPPFKEYVTRQVKTVVGTVRIRRASYHSTSAEPSSVRPLDEQLGVHGDCSEGLEELMAFTAGQLTYDETVRLLSKTLGVRLCRTKVQRVAGEWGRRVCAHRGERLPREAVPPRVAVAMDGAMLRTAERRSKRNGQWSHRQRTQLKAGKVDEVIKELTRHARRLGRPRRNSADDDPRRIIADNLRYFQRNAHRMDYKRYRQRGYPISSGVVESGCKHVIAQRMRITASMSWHEQTPDAILQLRCLIRSNQWDRFWNSSPAIA